MNPVFSAEPGARARRALAAGLATVGLTACNVDKLTTVTTPDVVPPSTTTTVASLPAVFNSAIGDFGVAYQGSSATEGQILYAGLMADEFLLSDTFDTRRQIDVRNIFRNNSNNDAVYRQLQIARVSAERAASSYTALMSSIPSASMNSSLTSQAEAYAIAGYTYLFFAENYCSGVPFSAIDINTGKVTNGAPVSTVQMLALASAKFDSAIAIATPIATAVSPLRLAKIGKARTLVDQGQYAPAAALVTGEANVPSAYQYLTYSNVNSARQNNGVWSFNNNQGRFSAANSEGTNGLPYRTDNDPRVLIVRSTASVGFDAVTPLYVAVKYSEQGGSTVLASGIEARLIEAEAAYQTGNFSSMISILNGLRSFTPSLYACPNGVTLTNFTCPTTQPVLAPLADPGPDATGTNNARLRLLFKERAYWLYLTAHRLGDMRRLARSTTAGLSGYGLGVNSVFPVGAYTPQPGTTYGNQTSMPVPFSEEGNNPLYTAAACDNVTP